MEIRNTVRTGRKSEQEVMRYKHLGGTVGAKHLGHLYFSVRSGQAAENKHAKCVAIHMV